MVKKLGIYDSGLGGVSLLKELLKAPFVDEIFYYSDYEKLPYGDLTVDELQQRGVEICQYLLEQEVDAILLACNTATVNTISFLRQQFKVPFVGVEPYINALKKEAVLTNKQKVGLIMTPATAKSTRVNWLKQQFDLDDRVTFISSPSLARHIEDHLRGKPELIQLIEAEISELSKFHFDALILGCTHYPLVQDRFEKILNIPIIDPAPYVISHLKNIVGGQLLGPPAVYYSESFKRDWKLFELYPLRDA